jgi:hypothetical protein
MSAQRAPYVFASTLRLLPEADPAEVGAAVTIELCGHWEHEGGCRAARNEIRREGERRPSASPRIEADECNGESP